MFAILNRHGHELAVIIGSESRAKVKAIRIHERKGIPVRVVNLSTGEVVANY